MCGDEPSVLEVSSIATRIAVHKKGQQSGLDYDAAVS